jgi:tyrosyl-tRNA synthetase
LAVIKTYEAELVAGANPRDYKLKLAHELVRLYHSEEAAQEAENYFIKTISNKEVPTELSEFKPTNYELLAVLVESGLVASKSAARRLVEQGGVKVDGAVVKDGLSQLAAGNVLQKGKFHFLKIS